MNSFFASVEQQENPALRGRPVIVVPMLSDGTCAIAASREAKRQGIRTGTMVAEAKRLCPDVRLVVAQHHRYVAYHQRIMAEIEQHIPVTRVASIDEAYCTLIGRERQPDNARALALRIKAGLARCIGAMVTCSIGIAPNRLLAKMAADRQKPDGLVLLQQEDLPAALNQWTLADVPGVGTAMAWRLYKAGITTLRAFWDVSPKQARALWGSVEGERLWALLHGMDVPETPTQRSTLGHSHVLAPVQRAPVAAYRIARRLTLKAASRLRRLGYTARAFTVSIRLENRTGFQQDYTLEAACDNSIFAALVAQAWQAFTPRLHGQRVKKVGVVLAGLQPMATRQQCPLFWRHPNSAQQARQEALSFALDRLNQRFGANTILPVDVMAVQMGFPVGTKVAFTRIPDAEEFHE